MSALVPLPNRDYSILTPKDLSHVKRRSQPPQPDYDAIAEQERRRETHARLTTLTSSWQNTIARNRLDRQTRLQRAAEAEEQRKLAIDGEEKKIQKLKRQAKLAEAATIAFSQRPEVRAVNSQLLLHEVQLERDEQVLLKERKKVHDMRLQMDFDEDYNQRYRDMLANEERILAERREKARATAAEFRRQKAQKEAEKMREREEDLRDGKILAEQIQYELDLEKQAEADGRRRAAEFNREMQAKNMEMERYRESLAEIEELEERKLREERERVMDQEDERRAAEERRKREKVAARQKLIDAESKRQEIERVEQRDFLEKQLAEQHEKEKKEITEMNEKRVRLLNERRQDYLESRALAEERGRAKLEREQNSKVFPWDGDEQGNEEFRRRQAALGKAAKDQAAFQRAQAKEKREREVAEREREKLEFKHRIEADEAFLRRAQDYACELLQKAKDDDDSDLQYYTNY